MVLRKVAVRSAWAPAVVACAALSWLALRPAGPSGPAPESRPAIGYYLVVGARLVTPQLAIVRGASNLPAGAVLTVRIYNSKLDVVGGAVRAAVVGADGLFIARVRPNPGLGFEPDGTYICSAVFQPDPHTDAPAVINAVGPRGERLGDADVNPEIAGNSGGRYLSEEALAHW
jgi:hypothetical protein